MHCMHHSTCLIEIKYPWVPDIRLVDPQTKPNGFPSDSEAAKERFTSEVVPRFARSSAF